MLLPRFNGKIYRLFDDVPPFYNVRQKGLQCAVMSALRFRTALRCELSVKRADTLIFEKRDVRNHLITAGLASSAEPLMKEGIYCDRRDLIQHLLGARIPLKQTRPAYRFPRTVAINPASRVSRKSIPPQVVSALVRYLCHRKIRVRLIDPDGTNEDTCRGLVESYWRGIDLNTASAVLRQSDLYIGADSLFIHLAYYLDVPFVTLYNQSPNLYFAPPGVKSSGNYMVVHPYQDEEELEAKIEKVLC